MKKRGRFSITGELLIEMFKKDIIYIENNNTIPLDSKFIKTYNDSNTDIVFVEYESEESPEIVEGANKACEHLHTMNTKFKSIFKRTFTKKK